MRLALPLAPLALLVAARGVGRVVFEGLSLDTQAVESVFDLPREPGSTGYFSIRILHSGRRPEVAQLSTEAGKALIDSRSPAPSR